GRLAHAAPGDVPAGAAQLHRLQGGVEAVPHGLPRAGPLPALHRHRRRSADRDLRAQWRAHPVRRVRRPGHARGLRLQRRAHRHDLQRLLQAEVRQALRPDARHTADDRRHRPWRDRLGPAAGGGVRRGVPARHARPRPRQLVVGAAGAAGHAAHRVRVLRGVHGADDVDDELAGLRQDHPRPAAAVPLLRDVLPALGVPRLAPDRRRVHAALPWGRALPRAHHRLDHLGQRRLGRLPRGDGGRRPGRRAPAPRHAAGDL
ncbi:MAG: Efflux ABC transporter, permease protein, partial [uncultured Nocardioides sp.]